MPWNSDTSEFDRPWQFVDAFSVGDKINRSDLDIVANDLASGFAALYSDIEAQITAASEIPYLGIRTDDPTEGAGGSALVAGNWYIRSSDYTLRAYTGTEWQTVSQVPSASDFFRTLSELDNTNEWLAALGITDLLFKRGMIIMWSGTTSNIPSGWLLCDGTNGTPNLRDRFIVGAGATYAPGDKGGASSVTLSVEQIPAHDHVFSGTTASDAHNHEVSGDVVQVSGGSGLGTGSNSNRWWNADFSRPTDSDTHSHSFSGTTNDRGGGQSHENRPPYYALAFIMKA